MKPQSYINIYIYTIPNRNRGRSAVGGLQYLAIISGTPARQPSNCQSQEDREVTVLLISFQCCAREPHLEDLRSLREFLGRASKGLREKQNCIESCLFLGGSLNELHKTVGGQHPGKVPLCRLSRPDKACVCTNPACRRNILSSTIPLMMRR